MKKILSFFFIVLMASSMIGQGYILGNIGDDGSDFKSDKVGMEARLQFLIDSEFDLKDKMIIASLFTMYYENDYFLIGLVAGELQRYYGGNLRIVKQAFILDTDEFRLILGHGSQDNAYTIGGVDPNRYVAESKTTIFAACNSDKASKNIPIKNTDIKYFKGDVSIGNIITYLLLKYHTGGNTDKLLSLIQTEKLASITLAVTAPDTFVVSNLFLIPILLWALSSNTALLALEDMSTMFASIPSNILGDAIDGVELLGISLLTLIIFLEIGDNSWGATHINKKIKDGEYGSPKSSAVDQKVNNKLFAKIFSSHKPVIGIKVGWGSFNKLHVIWSEKCNDEGGGLSKGREWWDIVIGPSLNYPLKYHSIHTLKRYGKCDGEERTAAEAIAHFTKVDQKNKRSIQRYAASPVPSPYPEGLPNPSSSNSGSSGGNPVVFTPSQTSTIWDNYLLPILTTLFLAAKAILNAIKWIDNKFAEWGGGYGSNGHIGLWIALGVLLTGIALYILAPNVVINIGRFLATAAKYLAAEYGGAAAITLASAPSYNQPLSPPSDSVAAFLSQEINESAGILYDPSGFYYHSDLVDPDKYIAYIEDTDKDGITDYYEIKYWDYTNTMIEEMNSQLPGNPFPLIPSSEKAIYMDPNVDYDQDGLTNAEEYIAGTHPWVKDTDGDGLTDASEVNGNLPSNPLNPDSDGDYLPDDQERKWGTDPSIMDTDGDGFNDAWEIYTSQILGWKPIIICQGSAGCGNIPLDPTRKMYDAAFADSDNDGDGLNNSMEARYHTDPTKSDTDGDGISDYREVFPFAQKGGMRGNALYNFRPYFDVYGNVPSTNPYLADTDGDGYSDYEELTSFISPISSSFTPNSDIDEDGMLDYWEYKMGLDPFMMDAHLDYDQDGLTNLQEHNANTDPFTDSVAPTFNSITPSSNTITYRSSFKISASASDNKGVTRMNLRIYYVTSVYGGLKQVDIVNKNYYTNTFTYYWDTRYLDTSRTYFVVITAYDTDSNTAVHTKSMSVDSTGPNISITSHYNGQIVSGIDRITVSASDSSGIRKVQFYIDNSLKYTDYSAPYQWSWDTSTVSNGYHTIKIIAYDNYGNYRTSSISVKVSNGGNTGGGGGGSVSPPPCNSGGFCIVSGL